MGGDDTQTLRPEQCPHCGKSFPHHHGYYPRKADRQNSAENSLNPIPIFRFRCDFCKRTCSVLPECIPPRRWYLWIVQQAALLLICLGYSKRSIASKLHLARSTVRRWEGRLQEMFKIHAFHLCSREPTLGVSLFSYLTFWDGCLKIMSLARAMYWIHHAGCAVP